MNHQFFSPGFPAFFIKKIIQETHYYAAIYIINNFFTLDLETLQQLSFLSRQTKVLIMGLVFIFNKCQYHRSLSTLLFHPGSSASQPHDVPHSISWSHKCFAILVHLLIPCTFPKGHSSKLLSISWAHHGGSYGDHCSSPVRQQSVTYH